MGKFTTGKNHVRSLFVLLMIVTLTVGMIAAGALSVNAADDSKTQIEKYKSEAVAEINALKNDNSHVVSAVKRYLAQVDYAANTNNIPSEKQSEYVNKVHLELNDIVADAHKEVEFLNKRLELLGKLQADYSALVASGRYTGDARPKLDQTYKGIAHDIGKVTLAEGISKLNSVYAGAKAKFDGVESFVKSLESEGKNGDLTGRVYSTVGFPSSKNLRITKQATKNPSGVAPRNDLDKLTADDIKAAITDKQTLFTFHLRIEGYNDVEVQDNGAVYTVRIELADEYLDGDGYSVISYDADGNEYVHNTIKYGKYVEFKTSMLSNDFTLVSDIVKDMTWLIVVLALAAVAEIVVTAVFTNKKNKLMSVAVLPFMAVMYSPGSFAVVAGILGAVAITGAALSVLSGVVYAKAKKAKAEEEATEDTASEATEKTEPADSSDEKKDSETADKEATAETAEDETNPAPEEEESKEEDSKKPESAFIPMAYDEEEEKEEEKKERSRSYAETDLEDGAYGADDERYNGSERKTDDDSDDATYEADTVDAAYVVVKNNDGDGAYEEDRERSYSGKDGEYEADGDTVKRKKEASDADAEYGLADDHIFASGKSAAKADNGSKIRIIPIIAAKTSDDDDQAEESDKDIVVLPEDGNEELTNEMRVFSAEDGEKVYVTYDYSFDSKLRLSAEETRYRYQVISDTLLSYGLRKRQSWKQERYYAKGKNYVKLIFRGKTPCICFAVEPSSLKDTKYSVEDVSSIKKYEDGPSMMRVRSGRGCKYAI
ncbi:MAG: hypothetical protein IJV70_07815, partial [Clostridia bacterium]|nr:hypothetical protein [Clostridia bacterium]